MEVTWAQLGSVNSSLVPPTPQLCEGRGAVIFYNFEIVVPESAYSYQALHLGIFPPESVNV